MSDTSGLVLVVGDDLRLREPLEHLLRRRRYDVMAAGSAEAALEAVQHRKPDAAIIDAQVDEGAGHAIVSHMPPRAPVILFAGGPSAGRELARRRPRTRHVERPCSLTWLIDTLDEML